jgi:hypothetical protein
MRGYLLPFLLSLALGLRLVGIDHGHPLYVSGDERPIIADAVRFVHQGTLKPEFYNYPAFYAQVFSLALWGLYWLGYFADLGAAGPSLALAEWLHPVHLALVGRLLSALAGVGLVGLVYKLGKRAYGRDAGLGGALFAAVSPLLVHQARFALPEALMALLAIGACYYLVAIAQGGMLADYLKAGLCIGLAISTKYNAAMLLGGLATAHLLCAGKRRALWSRELAAGAGAVVLAFFLGSPHWLFSFSAYGLALLYESANVQFSLGERAWPLWATLKGVVAGEMGWGLLGLAGCGYALYRRARADWTVLAVVVPSLLYIGSWPKGGLHYLIHAFPLMGLVGTRLVLELGRRRPLQAGLLLLVSLPSAHRAWEQGKELGRKDVRLTALHWIEEHIPAGTTIGGYWVQYCPPLKSTIELEKLQQLIRGHAHRPKVVAALQEIGRRIPFYRGVGLDYYLDEPRIPPEYAHSVDVKDPKTQQTFRRAWRTYEELRRLNVEYAILPEAAYGRFLTGQEPPPGTAEHYYFTRNRDYLKQFFDPEDGRYELVREFAPDKGQRGSRIRLLRVR